MAAPGAPSRCPRAALLLTAALLSACTAALLSACTRPAPDQTSPPAPSGSAAAPSSLSSGAPPSPASSSTSTSSPSDHSEKLHYDTGVGEDLTDHLTAEVWIPDVEVRALTATASSLWWSDAAGIHERPFDGEARTALAGPSAVLIAADDEGVYYADYADHAETSGKKIFDLQVLRAGAEAPRRLARVPCSPRHIALATAFVVVSTNCSILAVPRAGGAPRVLAPEAHYDVEIAARGDLACAVNDGRITCRSLAGRAAKPRELTPTKPRPLLLDDQALYWLEDAAPSDVPMDGDFGRLIRWDLATGERKQLTSSQVQAYGLVDGGSWVYYFTERGSLRRVRKDGSRVQTLHTVGWSEGPKLAIAGGYAFWSRRNARGVYRLRLPPE